MIVLKEKKSDEDSLFYVYKLSNKVTPHPPGNKPRRQEETYSLKGLQSLPCRLASPPPISQTACSSSNSSATDGQKPSSKGFWRKSDWWVRSPACLVLQLSDVINNVHFSPLSAQEFEDYLIYDELSPENLYFYHWVDAYTRLFEKKTKKTKGQSVPISSIPNEVIDQFQFGIKTFLSGGLLELNLPAKLSEAVKISAETTVDPLIFGSVKREVIHMLESSKQRWLSKNSGNANRNRATLAIGFGVLFILSAITLVLLLLFFCKSRAARVSTAPLVWFGTMSILQGLKRTCPLIYAFGNLRQLYPWELMRANTEIKMNEMLPSSFNDSSKTLSPTWTSPENWHAAQKVNTPIPVFSPVTKIDSPLMTRILHYHIISGASWAILFAIIWLSIWIPLPILAR
ncbi:hypothetical protein CROQUDRAFT_61140 [Cronartium quercuum f. sp. fusiforme G11]|uniref:RGS domain-containing protein n=1 Tax=Cronartium quercuum f. sp. fusiforme G11 TaxID=708437 RepID=A0A9P6TEN0_9BASI|nr:hypothetical protein CROQUDRAFT_61140 [Cronartium quercuum f. sp. fusiforme G11]